MFCLYLVWLTSVIILRDIILLLGGFYIRYITLDPPKTLARFFDVTQPSMRMKPTAISKVIRQNNSSFCHLIMFIIFIF